MKIREQAIEIWRAGVAAVGGYGATERALKSTGPVKPDHIIAVGKAAAEMMRAARDHFGPVPGLIVTKDGHAEGLAGDIRLFEAAHPVPDARSLVAGKALRETVNGMAPGAQLLLLVSGGASSLAEDLTTGKSLDDLMALNQRLLAGGLDITAMNRQRRRISRIKGGGLLRHFSGGAVNVLAISDVPGDDLAVIGSGLGCAPEGFGFAYNAKIIASNTVARQAAVFAAQSQGYEVLAQEECLHGDLVSLAVEIGQRIRTMPKGVMILGGEPTVILPANPGRGGRNQALALTLAKEIAGLLDICVLVAGTDGSDGPTDAAGGVIGGATWGAGAKEALERADSGHFLEQQEALFTTGPTGTNVMDLLVAIRE